MSQCRLDALPEHRLAAIQTLGVDAVQDLN
jgi:hypothetical protein